MVAATIRWTAHNAPAGGDNLDRPSVGLEELARTLVARHGLFHGRAEGFQFVQQNDVLTIRGCVPTFYLKQVLQTVLQDLDGIRRVDNQVDVVSPCGLSSVRSAQIYV